MALVVIKNGFWILPWLVLMVEPGCSKDDKAETRRAPEPAREVKRLISAEALGLDPVVANLVEGNLRYVKPIAVASAAASTLTPATTAQIELGRRLFFEERLSASEHISCNSCHPLSDYGVDGLAFSFGHGGANTRRNAPTVFNSLLFAPLFWDGRAESLEAQAREPLLHPHEMALPDEATLEKTLTAIPGYAEAFERAFPEQPKPVTFSNAVAAIAAFERQLITPAPFDDLLQGDSAALSADALRGLERFIRLGCISCHAGTTFGGHSLELLGVKVPWPNQDDQGRYEVTRRDIDKMRFRAPSLRNVAKTAPYFHDASAETLPQALRKMAKHQLDQELSDEDVRLLVEFFAALTGRLPQELIRKPELL